MLARDHYATLGVPPNATDDEIDEAHRHLSRRYHPDVNPGDPHAAAVYERIAAAYAVLSDPQRRTRYDAQGAPAELDQSAGPDLNVQLLPDSGAAASYRDLFRWLRDHARRSGPVQGDDIHATVEVPLLHAARGRRAQITAQRRHQCHDCGGRGRVQLQRERPCSRCAGTGEENYLKGALSVTCECAECDGTGLATGRRCERCGGSGAAAATETIIVRIPGGISDGQMIRIAGQGHRGLRGGPAGDLVIRVRVVPLPGWRQHGADLHGTVRLSASEAILGARVDIDLPDGDVTSLRVPPNTAAGFRFRLRGRGLEMSDGQRGDMLVRAEIEVPEVVDEESRDLIRQFARRHPHNPRREPVRESQE